MSDRELLETVFVWLKVGVSLGVFIALQLFAVLYLKWVIYKITVAYLKRADETLTVTKEWSYLAHNQHKDAQRVMEKVEQRADQNQTVVRAVEAVPEITATKVVEKIAERADSIGDSARLKVVPVPPQPG